MRENDQPRWHTGPQLTPTPRRDHNTRTPQLPTRRDRVTAIMTADPHRAWTGRELAERLQIKPRNLLTQLGQWTHGGFFTRTGHGTYTLDTPP